jgi:hypothetical protein
MNAALEAALGYALRGWPVFPCRIADKRPLTAHGFYDATLDQTQIRKWCWTAALVAIATGKPSGIVALDIDIREGGSGLDSLQALGANFNPETRQPTHPVGAFTGSSPGRVLRCRTLLARLALTSISAVTADI